MNAHQFDLSILASKTKATSGILLTMLLTQMLIASAHGSNPTPPSGSRVWLTGNLDQVTPHITGQPHEGDVEGIPSDRGVLLPILDNIQEDFSQTLPPQRGPEGRLVGARQVSIRRVRLAPGRINPNLGDLFSLLDRRVQIRIKGRIFVPGAPYKYSRGAGSEPGELYLALELEDIHVRGIPVPMDLPLNRERLVALAVQQARTHLTDIGARVQDIHGQYMGNFQIRVQVSTDGAKRIFEYDPLTGELTEPYAI